MKVVWELNQATVRDVYEKLWSTAVSLTRR